MQVLELLECEWAHVCNRGYTQSRGSQTGTTENKRGFVERVWALPSGILIQ